jgi:hypothetical protein
MESQVNIFYLDHDPVKAAEWMVDKHVVKMILESAQLLSTAHRVLDGRMEVIERYVNGSMPARYRKLKRWRLDDGRDNIVYQATHMNHPSAVWCRQSVENYAWLVEHFYALMNEYMHRYNKVHACNGELAYSLQSPPHNLKEYDWTPMPSAMAPEYKISDDPCTNYRNYYKIGKAKMHKWTNRQPPDWIL